MINLAKAGKVFMVWMLLPMLCLSQNIKGTVTDSLGKPVSAASVNLKAGGKLIIAYATTNDKGAYTMNIPTDADKSNLLLEVSCLGFKKQSKAIGGLTEAYNFKLSTSVNMLQDVKIKNTRPVLRRSGDTISYKVSDFSSPQDRVIGEVIKRLPGIDVAEDGKISYNGKNISNLYIGGDNLLDDKYNIATNNIPNGVVDQVQVMENHQPVKMLQNKVVSDDVALNLTIKKDAKMQLIGQETVGGGLPGNYFADLNAMMFKDKYKGINYFKGNNTSLDVGYDLTSHNRANYLSNIGNDQPATLLSLGTAGAPDLPRNRYLFNRSGLFNLNNLVNVQKDVQLRANISYLFDGQRQDYRKSTELYFPNDTIRYAETQYNRYRPDVLRSQLSLNMNKSKFYLNNVLITDYSRNTTLSALVANGVPVNQVFKDNSLDLSNEFNFMKTFKNNNIIEFYSYINRFNEPEDRVINPGLNPDIFNNNIGYARLTQNANVPSVFTNNYVSYKIPGNWFTQSYRAGFSIQSQSLRSDLSVTQYNGNSALARDSARNNLDWHRNKLYGEAAFDVPGEKLKLNFTLPLSLQQIDYKDALYNLDKGLTRFYFDPRVSLKYQTGIEDFVNLAYSFRNNIGGIEDVYRGYILTNYRSLYANNADLTERQSQTASIGYNFRKAITLFFFSVNAAYTHQYANNIATSVVTNNIQQRVVLPFDNNMDTWVFNGYTSKYSFGLRTTFNLGANYQTTKLNQIQNGIILPYTTIIKSLNGGTETKVNDKLNFSYKANYSHTTSQSSAVANVSKFERLVQTAALYYNPLSNLFTSFSMDHYYTRQQQANDLKYMFADVSIRYRFVKTKLDIEVSAQNLLNTTDYTAVYLAANVFTTSNYTIPGRIILTKLTFSL